MPAVVACPKCKAKYKLPDEILGKPIKCKSCGATFQTKAPKSAQAVKKQPVKSGPKQAASAELAALGIDGPLKGQPDLFSGAAAGPAKGDILGNLAADPGFAESMQSQPEVEDSKATPDGMEDIFRNPYMPPPSETKKGKIEYGKGDPNYTYGPVKIFAILGSIGVALECSAWVAMSSIFTFFLPAADEIESAAEGSEVMESALYFIGIILVFALLAITIQIFTAVMVMIFMYRSNANVRALGATDLKISPGWSVGWWFIPFMNLFKPLQSMSEIYRASQKPKGSSWAKISAPGKVNLWWICFIVANILNRVQERVDQGIVVEICNWGGTALHIVSGIMLVMIMFDISKMQSRHASEKYGTS